MKNITESIRINEGVLRGRLTNNDKKNFAIVADALANIVSELSDWMEMDEENEYSDTADLAHSLSNLRDQLRGEWPEEITFNFQ